MSALLNFLYDRLNQLNDRKRMIPRYLKKDGFVGSKRDFKLDDIPKIEHDIQETQVAIDALQAWRVSNRKKKGNENIKAN